MEYFEKSIHFIGIFRIPFFDHFQKLNTAYPKNIIKKLFVDGR